MRTITIQKTDDNAFIVEVPVKNADSYINQKFVAKNVKELVEIVKGHATNLQTESEYDKAFREASKPCDVCR